MEFEAHLKACPEQLLADLGLSADVTVERRPGIGVAALNQEVHLRHLQNSRAFSVIAPGFRLNDEEEFELICFRMAATCITLHDLGIAEAEYLPHMLASLASNIGKENTLKRSRHRVDLTGLARKYPDLNIHIAVRVCLPYLVRIREHTWTYHQQKDSPEGPHWWLCFGALSRLLGLSQLRLEERGALELPIQELRDQFEYAARRAGQSYAEHL